MLFAVTDASRCAESLPYGTAGLTESSTAYLSTQHKNELHSEWFQILQLTSGGTVNIRWQFSDTKTLQSRFQTAVSSGEPVTWTITYGGATYSKSGSWRFSNNAGNMLSKFAGSGSGFSGDDGMWGGGTGTVDGNGNVPSDFWGHGNPNSGDGDCSTAYLGSGRSTVSKNFMYFGNHDASPSLPPSGGEEALFYGLGTASPLIPTGAASLALPACPLPPAGTKAFLQDWLRWTSRITNT